MKLIRARVQNFRSIEDSGEFEISDLTCLVGKNEAGKSALLQALLGLRPVGEFSYDKTRDYPRRYLTRFDERHENGKSVVATTWWSIEAKDQRLTTVKFGESAVTGDTVTVTSHIGEKGTTWAVPINERNCLEHLMQKHALDAIEQNTLKDAKDGETAVTALAALPQRTPKQEALLIEIKACRENSFHLAVIDILSKAMPRFFYTSHFDRMSGEISLNQLANDKQHNTLSVGDKIFLDFIEYAGTTIEELQKVTKYEELKAQCEAASNDITDEIFQFWSQNEALEVKIDIGEGKSGDPAPFNAGSVVKIRIENRNHRASIPLSERSAGFVWFFSFLSQFKQLRKVAGNAIMLLDEPGLTLHGKAQADLLRYMQERLLPSHQVIFTTHSPFMVPMNRIADIRVVEDVVERDDRNKPIVRGTKVKTDVLHVDQETLFPLQGALGYEITQSLFIGKNTLLVEGPSDILYLYAASQALKSSGRTGLSQNWTICPSGGIDKISPFVSLFGGNSLNVAVLSDLAKGDKGKIERLKKTQILRAGQLLTAVDFTGKSESDIEDFFHIELYAQLLNATFKLPAGRTLDSSTLNAADTGTERNVKKAEAAFKIIPPEIEEFDHYSPADWLIRNSQFLQSDSAEVSET